ncbi:hypothetical protein GOODEAATRI_015497 [Goodea atripinnis]|uniref:Uncharacterized protein n=1 Tax=Goodea atripinnis TaxID=208336 RepID=A0ABV0PPD2_9TELE
MLLPSSCLHFGPPANHSTMTPNTKRKPKQPKGAKPKKMQVKEKGGEESESDGLTDSDSDRESSDSSIPDGQRTNEYRLEQVRSFLEVTKGKRDVAIDDFFP